jgi:hypothetical protein
MEETNTPQVSTNNNLPSATDLLKNLGGGFRGQSTNVQTAYKPEEWENYTDRIKNIYGGDKVNDIAAYNQKWYNSYINSIARVVPETVAEFIKTPAYLFSDFDTMEENPFFKFGKMIQEGAASIAPVYVSEEARNKVFDPFDSEYMSDYIVNLGPTIAMMAIAIGTDGLATPAILSGLGKVSNVAKIARASQMAGKAAKGGRFARAAETIAALEKANPELFAAQLGKARALTSVTRGVPAAFASRLVVAGMEGLETYKQVEEKLRQDGVTDTEEIKKKANAAAYDVHSKNMSLVVLDYLQYATLFIKGLGGLATTKLGKAATSIPAKLGSQMLTEGAEEAAEFTFSQQAQDKVLKGKDDGFLETLYANLDNADMQKAFVQGALGGVVFEGIGSIATAKHRTLNKMASNNEDIKVKTDETERRIENTTALIDDSNTDTSDLEDAAIQEALKAKEAGDVEGANIANTVATAAKTYKQSLQLLGVNELQAELDVATDDTKREEIKNEIAIKKEEALLRTKLQVLASTKKETTRKLAEQLTEVKDEFDNQEQKDYFILKTKLDALKASKAPAEIKTKLKEKLQAELEELVTDADGKRKQIELPTLSNQIEIESSILDIIGDELAIEKQKVEQSTLGERKEKIKEERKEKEKEIEESELSLAVKKAKRPEEMAQFGNNPTVKAEKMTRIINEKLGDERDTPILNESTVQDIKDYYTSKPFAAEQVFGKPIDMLTDTEIQDVLEQAKRTQRNANTIESAAYEIPPTSPKPDPTSLDVLLDETDNSESDIKAKRADIGIGKVGNTEYEVKVDGVYYQGKKLNNPENKTHRQLIEADIERRRQEELNNFPYVKDALLQNTLPLIKTRNEAVERTNNNGIKVLTGDFIKNYLKLVVDILVDLKVSEGLELIKLFDNQGRIEINSFTKAINTLSKLGITRVSDMPSFYNNLVNAKYDAELKSLESTTPANEKTNQETVSTITETPLTRSSTYRTT